MHTIDFFHHFLEKLNHVVGTCDLFDAICLMKIHIFLSEQWENPEGSGKMSLIFLLKPLDFFSLLHGEFATDPPSIYKVQCGDP